jgi:hypothetical protein
VYYKCVKFHKNPISGLGGVALTRYMDERTDGQGDSYIHTHPPPNFVCAGIITLIQFRHITLVKMSFICLTYINVYRVLLASIKANESKIKK